MLTTGDLQQLDRPQAGGGHGEGPRGGPTVPPVAGAPVKLLKPTSALRRRRSYAIRCYVGLNGSGKSASAVRDLIPDMYLGRPILSTVPLYDHRTGDLYRNYVPFDSWRALLDPSFRDGVVFMDEITGIANARDSMGLPRAVQALLDKLRKSGLQLLWTAPDFSRADKTLRSTTQLVTLCRGYFPKAQKGGSMWESTAWRPNRLFRLRSFNGADFDEFTTERTQLTATKNRRLRARPVEWWRGPGSTAFASYDTFEAVSRVGEVSDSGTCAYCGGYRARVKCTCED